MGRIDASETSAEDFFAEYVEPQKPVRAHTWTVTRHAPHALAVWQHCRVSGLVVALFPAELGFPVGARR